MIKKIHHSQITVKNLEESIIFFKKLGLRFNGTAVQRVNQKGRLKSAEMRIAFFKAGDDTLELIEYINPKPKKRNELDPWDTGAQHVCFEVDDITKLYQDLKGVVKFYSPPIAHKTDEIDVTWTYFKDSNGSIIEIIETH